MPDRINVRTLLEQKGQLADDVVAIKTDGKIIDLHSFVDPTTTYEVVRATDKDGIQVIRHSTAHVMADAVQKLFPGTKVTIGPAIEDGFYYDFEKAGGGSFSDDDLAKIEKTMREIVKSNTPFRKEMISRNDALALFEKMGENFKVEIIKSIPEGEEISLYRHGKHEKSQDPKNEWVDVCEGPHVPRTSNLGAVKLTSVAGAYWRGDERNPMLQRIYGTAFPTQELLDEHLKLIEEAKARDHRKLGKELDLFMFDQVAPAMPFFLPRGAHVYNALVSYMRDLYSKNGYDEVITPQAFDPKLFRTSGHLGNYNENMYRLWTEDLLEDAKATDKSGSNKSEIDFIKQLQDNSFALKPMNCPSHCVIFGARRRSYRELPWRVADFGRLHRYERGGVVHGLSRVRSFCQDDAHIFCTKEQVADEITKFLKLFYDVYKVFDLTKIDIRLATRPEKRIGSDEDWDMSERALQEGLEKAGLPFTFSPGEGAFYGPKLEFHVQDALKRSWQLGTMQYDPNLPERFDLTYVGEDGKEHRPVMLHRAVFGTLERFMSVYLEHCGGNLPAWLAPMQAIVLTVSDKSEDYGRDVLARLRAKGFRVEADFSGDKLGAKIRNARIMRHPYMLILGPKDSEAGTVSVRSRDKGELGAMPFDQFVTLLGDEGRPPS
ncbi:Threonyl-tRNA synthetase [Labilithrix luteola]|uniref:Threonine--tRNA ligase n=1 Tax=Labilithrix luteola TaxID=1391654 RepID=A0A0K1PV02_9BACT|nr:threonine--tRNA ligase [Labilithrix luteola]AKU96959.1 Threonyl-tRNA synthetase [Labilithrix luteola]